MTTISSTGTVPGTGAGILDRAHTIAKPGFNRWMVPPAALCIHLCIGMAYGFSVFWLPLSRAVGLTAPKACPDISLFQELFTNTCDWKGGSLGGLAGARRSPQGRRCRCPLLGRWSFDRRLRHLRASALDHVAGFRRDRRC